jgi:rhomboid family GlyGly-CTERM serine protease
MNAPAVMRTGQDSLPAPWWSLSLVGAAALAWLIFGAAPEGWVFDRAAIAQGEWWRLLSAHIVHGDPAHAAWDIAALLLLGLLFEPRLQWRLPLVLLGGVVAVDAWLWWGEPGLLYYCGLSGILNSLMVFGLLQWWRDERHPLLAVVAAAAGLKIILEINAGQALLTQTVWPSVPAAHAAGYACGLVLASVTLRKWKQS